MRHSGEMSWNSTSAEVDQRDKQGVQHRERQPDSIDEASSMGDDCKQGKEQVGVDGIDMRLFTFIYMWSLLPSSVVGWLAAQIDPLSCTLPVAA